MSLGGRIVFVGGGAFAREVICWIEQVRVNQPLPQKMGFLDRSADVLNHERYPLEYFGSIDDFVPLQDDQLIMAIGDPQAKQRAAEQLITRGGTFVTLVHPSAVLASTAVVEAGVVICPQAMVSADARVERLSVVNSMASVGHDAIVGAYSTLSSHVDLTGGVMVGRGCFFGSGARILPKVKIGAGARIGAGAVVMRNVPAGATMYAMSARRL